MEVYSSPVPHKPLYRQRSFSFDASDSSTITGDDFYHSDQFQFGDMSEVFRLGITPHKVARKWKSGDRLALALTKNGYESDEEDDCEMLDLSKQNDEAEEMSDLTQPEEDFQNRGEFSKQEARPVRESHMICPVHKPEEEWTNTQLTHKVVKAPTRNKNWDVKGGQLHIVPSKKSDKFYVWRMTATHHRNVEDVYFFGFQTPARNKYRFVCVDENGNVSVWRPEGEPLGHQLEKEMSRKPRCRAFCIGQKRGNRRTLLSCRNRSQALRVDGDQIKTGPKRSAEFWEW